MNNNYVVIVYGTVIETPYTFGFDDYDKAKEYLEDLWQDDYNKALSENIHTNEIKGCCEDGYAEIIWCDDQYIRYYLDDLAKPVPINGKSYV